MLKLRIRHVLGVGLLAFAAAGMRPTDELDTFIQSQIDRRRHHSGR